LFNIKIMAAIGMPTVGLNFDRGHYIMVSFLFKC